MSVVSLTSIGDLFPSPDFPVLYPDLNDEGTFYRMLKRERARSDRRSQRFSLVAFQFDTPAAARSFASVMRRVGHRRLRPADLLGWLDRRRIGVLLPNTSAEGAWTLARDILRLTAIDAPPDYQIYLYPAHTGTCGFMDETPAGERPFVAAMETLFGEKMPLWKRVFDITGALTGLILFFPVCLAITLLIKWVSSGPVLFKQKRVGFLGNPFMCLKFRTMKIESDPSVHKNHVNRLMKAGAPLQKLDATDDRIIPFGTILRKSGLDELPQLLNVLRGEMSIVGPRPECYDILNSYTQWCTRRFDVTPGLTGLWQVSGKNRTTYNEMMRLDIGYVMKRSFWFDIKIILKTVPAIFGQIRGVS